MSSSSQLRRSGRLWSTTSSSPATTHTIEAHLPDQSSLSHERPESSDSFSDPLVGPDFLTVLDASTKYNVPSVKLRNPELASLESENQTIILGSGLTSKVVQYAMTDEDPVKGVSDKVVALKTFTRASSSKMARRKVYESIIREMEVLCNPLLAGNANIVQLHFVGWKNGEPFPALAMEQGSHGSLDYLIRSSWSGLTDSQVHQVRQHITIDIAMGLYAIHKAGFIHGDLKPENILVMSHPDQSRRVVVKLTDFGGSSLIPGEDGGRPVHYTPLWCAPEVINKDPDIDWERADIYSYGLVVGSLWASDRSSGGFSAERLDEPSSCFLVKYVLSTMTEEDEMEMLWLMKSGTEEVLGRNLHHLLQKSLDDTIPNEYDRTQILDALAPTLRAYFWLRPNTETLVRSLRVLAMNIGRNIENEMTPSQRVDVKAAQPPYGASHWPFSWDRSRDYFSIIVEQSNSVLEDIKTTNGHISPQLDLPDAIPEDINPFEYLHNILETYKRLAFGGHGEKSKAEQEAIYADRDRRARLSWFVAISSMAEPKSKTNLQHFKNMMYTSAMAGDVPAMCAASLLLNGTDMENKFPIRFSLSLLALSQSNYAASILYDRWPAHYNAVQQLIKLRPSAFELSKSHITANAVTFFIETITAYAREVAPKSPPGFKQALDMGLLKDVREALEGESAPVDFNESVAGSLHGLSNLPDTEAAALAQKAYQKGGKLSYLATAESPIASGDMFEDGLVKDGVRVSETLSPLSAAIRRCKPELALAIFSLHIEHEDEPIVDFDEAFIASCLYLHHEIAELLINLYHENPGMCLNSQRLRHSSKTLLSTLLLEIMVPARSYGQELERRLLHGDGHPAAYEGTLEILLGNGADPTGGFMHSSPFMNALRWDDLAAVKCIIKTLEDKNADTLFHLKDPANIRHDADAGPGLAALDACIQFGSIKAFEYLLQEFPSLVSATNIDGSATEVLHIACDIRDGTPFVEALLQAGADVTSRDEQGHTPVCSALLKGNLEAADAIARHCTAERLGNLLSRDPQSGWSIFAELLGRWRRNRGVNMIESFRWLVKNGGFHSLGPADVPVWYPIVSSPRPFAGVEQRLDVELLSLILGFDRLNSKTNTEMWDGITILHQSAWKGHVEVVRLLLESGWDPNVKMGYSGKIPEEQFPLGNLNWDSKSITPLDLVCSALSGLHTPEQITRGSFIEIQRWTEDLEEIRSLLLKKGGTGFIYEDFKKRIYSDAQVSNQRPRIVGTMPLKDAEVVTGAWPKAFFVEMPAVSTPKTTVQLLSDKRMESELIYNVMRSDLYEEQRKRLRELERQSVPKDYVESIRSRALRRKYEWRLPPDWSCSLSTEQRDEKESRRARYTNRLTGESVVEKPTLFNGELEVGDEKGKGKAIACAIAPESSSLNPGVAALSLHESNP